MWRIFDSKLSHIKAKIKLTISLISRHVHKDKSMLEE